jgi:hypothetical protein
VPSALDYSVKHQEVVIQNTVYRVAEYLSVSGGVVDSALYFLLKLTMGLVSDKALIESSLKAYNLLNEPKTSCEPILGHQQAKDSLVHSYCPVPVNPNLKNKSEQLMDLLVGLLSSMKSLDQL